MSALYSCIIVVFYFGTDMTKQQDVGSKSGEAKARKTLFENARLGPCLHRMSGLKIYWEGNIRRDLWG